MTTATPHAHPHPAVTHAAAPSEGRALRMGIGGSVGSGKTALVAAPCRTLRGEVNLAVVTNDIYTTEDADFLRRNAVLPAERITAVATGCCPHTAIRDDIAADLDAVKDLDDRFPGLELVLVESGGDNLTAVFSRGWSTRRSSCWTSPAATRCRARAAPASRQPICSSSTRLISPHGRGGP